MKKPLTFYALGHFAVDFLCAWLLFGRMAGTPQWVTLALVYNFCAFALQMPLGILADRLNMTRSFALLGSGLILLALTPIDKLWAACLGGLGNALYHVGGGRDTLLESASYDRLGIFVAPGAIGIFLGSCFRGSILAGGAGIALLVLCALGLLAYCPPSPCPTPAQMDSPTPGAAGRLAALFIIVFLRSLVGMTMAAPWKQGLFIAAAAVLSGCGKALGGIAAHRLGGKCAGGVSLLLSAVLFLLPDNALCGSLALLLFNMSMPITLGDSARLLKGGEGFAFGLLTFALFLGFLPAQYGLTITCWQGALLAALSGFGLLLTAERRQT